MTGGQTIRTRTLRLAAALSGGVAALFVAAAALNPALASGQPSREWQFRVLLDGEEIGYHRFRLERGATFERLESEAKFKVRFLFFDAYRYHHVNEELWRDDCLQRIEAQTEVNGRSSAVRGRRDEAGFVVATDDARAILDECVMSFAYWHPEFLDQDRLLNSQTGEYVPVAIEPVSEERLEVRGETVEAIRYSLDAEKLDMELWYTPEREWLALESRVKGGRLLRYELR
jgi:hypothetical protein